MDQPHEIHWRAAKRILNFVQGTRTHGIFYKAKSDLERVGFTDSDWEGEKKIKILLQDMCSCLQMDQLYGQVRSRVPLHSHIQRQSIEGM